MATLQPVLHGQSFIAVDGANFATCSGSFYDSGGPGANYTNNETIIVVLCPAGGAGAGPFTSVSFTQWAVAAGAGDRLRIHDGTSTAAPLLVEGNSSNSLAGLSFTATGVSGCLTFDWQSDGSGTAVGWTARIVTGPNAGSNASTNVCTNEAPFNMRTRLGGDPQPGGTWTMPGGGVHSSTFDPASDPAGVWTYTVSGPAPCPDSVATLAITKVTAPNAGTNGSVVLCSDDPIIQLSAYLGGVPDAGGSWTGPAGAHNGSFNPATELPGNYTYTVTGTAPCTNASATVSVLVNQRPNAGIGGSVTVCSNEVPFSLFAMLGGTADVGGTWTGPGGTAVSGTYTPGTSQPGNYTYTVAGLPPCAPNSAVVSVTQVTAPEAGANRSLTVCSDSAPFSMVAALNGTPDPGGTWSGPIGPHGDVFDPASDPAGAYTYTVAGTSPCTNDQAVLTITVRQAPNAGTSATTTVCSIDGSFPLFGLLGNGADAGGSWTGPGGATHPGTFIPGTSAVGIYTYTVVGQSPCTPATSTVTVNVNNAPVAGTSGSVTRCSVDPSFPLFTQLGGLPDLGGAWVGPAGAHSGTFIPGTDLPGTYTYTVTGAAPCANTSAVVNVTVVTAPNAGTDGALTVCSNAPSFSLFALLGGGADAIGSWTGPGNSASNGTFVPGTSAPGVYTYTVAGQAPCANDQSTVTVAVVQAPNPGTNGSITVCSNAPAIDLFGLLGVGTDVGGTWVRPGGAAHSGIYLPGSEPGGTYTYTVVGNAPCANASASVQVLRVIAPNAGTDGTITVCSTNGPFEMLAVLGGNPSGSGTWINASNASVGGTFTPGTTAAGEYRYIVTGTAPCANDTAQVTVLVNTAPNAGANASITVCSNDPAFSLLSVLNGTPNAGGTWTRPNGSAHSGTFTPGQSVPGGYTYTVAGITPCLSASAVVVVNVNQQPNAGTGGAFERCSTDGPVDLFALLGGSPQIGGSWTGPSGPTSSIFFPATSPAGNYAYTVSGTLPCPDAVATLMATVNQAPNAGTGGTLTVCSDQSVVDLFDGLGGDPDTNGTWSDDGNTGQLSGQFLNIAGLPSGDHDFTYTVPGIGQCVGVFAVVRVTVVGLLNAGTSGTMTVCGNNAAVDLFSGLGGSPQAGGQWQDLSLTGGLSGNTFNASVVGPGTYLFRYRLIGTVACASDSAQTSVTVVAPPSPGTSGTVTVCSNASSFGLFQFLGGTPQSGGIWRCDSLTGPMFNGTYNPNTDNPGVFFYIVSGSGPCGNGSATVTVSEVPAPDAGGSAAITVCSNGSSFNMTQQLSGFPQPGAWSFGGVAHGNLFVPGLDLQGIYEYRVLGQAPYCIDAVATLTISVEPAANAGTNSARTVCSTDDPFLLISVLGGNPFFNGSWIGPNGPHDGTFTPGSTEPGDYFYIVGGDGPCVNDTSVVSIFVNPAPNAGTSGSTTLCSGGAQVNLITVLGGAPDPSGSWVGPAPSNPSFGGIFVPGVSFPGVYTYSVTGAFPCPASVSSTVTVAVNQPPNAGISNAITRCSNSPGFAMVDQLMGTPAFNGTWVGPAPGNAPSNGFFIPGSSIPGLYTYTVPGTEPCSSAVATLNISVNPEPNAGDDAGVSVCSSGGAVNLFPLLGPNAQVGGAWTYLPSGAAHSGTFLPAVDLPGTYVYTVSGSAGCSSDIALITVVVNQSPDAGFNGLSVVCDDQDPFLLIAVLNGSPMTGGVWTAPGGAMHTGIFLPASDPSGVYAYTLQGQVPCPNATAQVTIIKNIAPDAGGNGVVPVCSSQAPFNLFNHLTGTPDEGGSWTDPAGLPFSGTYVPGASSAGTYKYKIIGLEPCFSDSAFVTVVQNTAPNAGFSSVALVCSSTSVFSLIGLLGGTPDQTGSWSFGGVSHAPFFDPSVDVSGAYVYTAEGNAPCVNDVAQVQITLVDAPSVGIDGAIAACVDDPAIPLFPGLGGSPQTGGTWSDDGSSGLLSGGFVNATGALPGSYVYTYTVQGLGPCPSASANVTVSIAQALNAGEDTSMEACASGGSISLFLVLGGQPQAGGNWLDLDGSAALSGNTFSPSLAGEGTWRFDYVLSGSGVCLNDTARVTVTVLQGPFAGCNGTSGQCSNFMEFNLISALTCGPDADGSWFKPDWTPHGNTFLPGTDVAGTYSYVVPGVGACGADTAQVVVTVTEAPNAGQDINVSICSTDLPLELFTLLGPAAQSGGNWVYQTGGNIPFSGIYNPAVDNPGNYRYRVLGSSPCSDDFAFVEVSEPVAPNAGCNALVNFCSGQAPVNMRLELGCAPQPGGTWVGPSGPHGNFFDPASDAPGVYVYTVAGVAPCADASSTLTIGVTPAANAGASSTVNACLAQTEVDLLAALGPLAQPGGTWTDVSGSAALFGNVFNPSLAGNGTWLFQYGFAANGPCPAVSRQVTVIVGAGANAGENNSVTICGAYDAFPLITALGGIPDAGGSWTDQLGTGALQEDGTLNANLLPPGTVAGYSYEVIDPTCGPVTATVVITVSEYPDPGLGGPLSICVTSGPVDLFAELQGTPGITGVWTGPGGAPHPGVFITGSDPDGPYSYTLVGNDVCPDTSTVIQVVVQQLPDAGVDELLLACDTLVALDLFAALGGTPQAGGTWSDLNGAGGLSGGFLNTSTMLPGLYAYQYILDIPACGSDTALLQVQVLEGVVVTELSTNCNTQQRTYTVRFTIAQGDPVSYLVDGLQGAISSGPVFVFTSAPVFTSELFEAWVSDQYGCASVRVAGESPCVFDDEVFVPQAFSPNGDGINDSFVIPGIEGYPANSMSIFNRWGGTMFEGQGYDNRSVVWDGTSPDGTYAGLAPAGTYFYVLDLGNGQPAITGYIYLNR